MLLNTNEQYGLVSRLLHWLVFLLVVGMLVGGKMLGVLPEGGIQSFAYSAHKSLGVVILLLMSVRLVWRLLNPRPRFIGTNAVLNYVAEVLHVCLYVLLLIQPLAGILMSQAHGYPVVLFGVMEMPQIIWHSPSLGGIFREIHAATAVVLAIVIAVHAAAALKHHYIDRDRTLVRMLKGH
jgi:cytochrome b561